MNWPIRPLIEVTDKIGSGSTPRGGDSVYVSAGTALIRSQNVYNAEFTANGLVYINDRTAEKMRGVSVIKDDILLNITGDSVARCCMTSELHLPARVNQHVAIIRAKTEFINPDFLMFYLVSPYMQAKLLSWAGAGGTRKALTKGMIEQFEVPTPPLTVQERIVDILKAYNDLIENNRRRIQLLEESARLLYQEWFVHLRFPGHEHVKVVDGVPEGWKATVIKSFGQVITGKTPSKKETDNYGSFMPFVKTPDMSSGAITLHANEYLSEKGASSQKNKTLPLGTVLISCIGTVGVVSITGCTCQTNQQINAVIPKEDTLRYYVYFTLKGLKAAMLAIGAGATMSNINKHKFENMAAVLPSLKLLENFHETVEPTFEQIKVLLTTNSKLEKARDLLLPRLMNGELL